MGRASVPHEVSVTNLIFGTVWFVTLPLDPGWEWRRGPSLPEVDARIVRGGRTVVASGRAWYALRHPERGFGCQLTIDVRPGTRGGGWERWSRGLATERLATAAHPVDVARGTARFGLPRRVEAPLLRLQLVCPEPERTIRLEV
ncbi:MAG: hypothetical protein IRY97_01145, partial [Thermomicrobiaceae bacterium]|nr:hypothetical protein [Thermomicrobiaceae bacterium]